MFRVLVAPEFEIVPSDPDFPPAILDALKTARDETRSNYVSFWAEIGKTGLKSNVILSTYPAAWLERYTEENYARIDPVIRGGLGATGAVIFDHENPETEAVAPLAADALRHNIGRYTIGIPAQFNASIRSVTTFATDQDVGANTEETGEILVKAREQAHIVGLAVVERFLKPDAPVVSLSDREIEVLYWGSTGKTDQQTSEIMNLSRWTVVAHVQSAKAKLRVNNKAAAIARALELQMFRKYDFKL
ncbi:helix-turn-helix transcriptional regulator [Oricola cellulosilytica]|uniref:HTH luxR-type domain-containing protein n=1 Tax=Oricola cellulosilytica TaxID=1429082 RepID=A0A4R0PCN0_9HYPH|nr:autoinducer binding domain-containing protein [Oricola cellulosilytica]TCD15222.1 hypothetical protein E0D97_06675 [Oricola cellulosilytica]